MLMPGSGVMLAQHLVSDHLGLDQVRHLLPQLAGRQGRLLLPPEREEFLLDPGQHQDVLPGQLGAALVNVSDQVQNYLHSSHHFLQGFSVLAILEHLGVFHICPHLHIELIMNQSIAINLSTETHQLLSSERSRAQSLLYLLKSCKLLCEVFRLLAATAVEPQPQNIEKISTDSEP